MIRMKEKKKKVHSTSVVPISHYASMFLLKWRSHLCLSRHWIQAGDSSLTQGFSFCNTPRDYLKEFLAGSPSWFNIWNGLEVGRAAVIYCDLLWLYIKFMWPEREVCPFHRNDKFFCFSQEMVRDTSAVNLGGFSDFFLPSTINKNGYKKILLRNLFGFQRTCSSKENLIDFFCVCKALGFFLTVEMFKLFYN